MAHHTSQFCTFCHGRDPHDNVKYTHCVKGGDGSIKCPFVAVTFCSRCCIQGHTAKHCTFDIDMMQLQMEAGLNLGIEQFEKLAHDRKFAIIMAREKLESMQRMVPVVRARYNYVMQLMRGTTMLDPRFFEQRCCRYCFNHNNHDPMFLTHRVDVCPRLACHTCRTCGLKGHTQAKCDKPMVDRFVREQGDDFIIDFDEE